MSEFIELTISGRLATPADPDWDTARLAWNLVADQRPSAVAFVESAEDVARTVRFAFAERPCDADGILPAETCARLAAVKRQWDPDGTIVANHAVSLDAAA